MEMEKRGSRNGKENGKEKEQIDNNKNQVSHSHNTYGKLNCRKL